MKIYVATAFGAKHRVHEFLAKVRERIPGAELSCDWTTLDEADGAREIAERERAGIADATVLVVLLPGGLGTHAELGMAIMACVPVLLVGEALDTHDPGTMWPRCIQYAHPRVRCAWTEADAVKMLELGIYEP